MTSSKALFESFDGVAALAHAVRSRDVSAVEVTRSYLTRIAELDAALR